MNVSTRWRDGLVYLTTGLLLSFFLDDAKAGTMPEQFPQEFRVDCPKSDNPIRLKSRADLEQHRLSPGGPDELTGLAEVSPSEPSGSWIPA
jgi:hypothetical protein